MWLNIALVRYDQNTFLANIRNTIGVTMNKYRHKHHCQYETWWQDNGKFDMNGAKCRAINRLGKTYYWGGSQSAHVRMAQSRSRPKISIRTFTNVNNIHFHPDFKQHFKVKWAGD